MNSGDWVDSLSALVEDYYVNWKINYYSELPNEKKDAGMNVKSRSLLQQETLTPEAPVSTSASAVRSAPSELSAHFANKRRKFKPVTINR